ncbi:MAG: hypothetical protein Q8K67_10535 [Geothrix sp.]|nr:hypothetical protein [Geothrix sp.]
MAFAMSGIKVFLLTGLSIPILAQAPMLQDGATVLRQARLDWTLGQAPLGPSSMPSFEVGWGGAGADDAYVPLNASEGLGQGTQGWGLGLQGRYVRGGWSFSATALALRDHGHTAGLLHRAAIAYQTESAWRAALEQAPFAWGSSLNGGDLLGDGARSFPRLSLSTPEGALPLGRWRAEAFAGRLEGGRPIPAWIRDRDARMAAQAAGLDLRQPTLRGALVRASFGALVEASFGALRMAGGRDGFGQPAPSSAARTHSLAELRVRIPSLARFLRTRGASVYVSRSSAPESRAVTLRPSRDLGGLQLVWDAWDLGIEYASAAPQSAPARFSSPSHLAGFSTHGDPVGPAFGREAITRTLDLGLPLFREGQGRLKLVRVTAGMDHPAGTGSWFLQSEARWRTPTGRVGATLASRRNEMAGSNARWGWAFSVFQSFRVF